MSQINGVGNAAGGSPVYKVGQPVQKQVPAGAANQLPVTDKVELSGMSHLLKALKANDVRADKVAAVKSAIEAGTYEDEQKMDVAVDRLLDELMK